MISKKGVVFLVLYALLVCAASVEGVVIPLDDSGWAMVVRPGLGTVSAPIVDRVTGDAVYIELAKTFNSPPQGGFLAPIIIEFQKVSPNATLNIIIRDEYIVNNTDTEWIDFHMSLLVDILNPQAGFNPDSLPDGDQLEQVYYNCNYGYQQLPIRLHFVDNDGSGVPSSPPGNDVFQPGYRGGKIVIATNPDMAVDARFGLKEVPTIPEPATLLILGMGGLVMTVTRRRRFV